MGRRLAESTCCGGIARAREVGWVHAALSFGAAKASNPESRVHGCSFHEPGMTARATPPAWGKPRIAAGGRAQGVDTHRDDTVIMADDAGTG